MPVGCAVVTGAAGAIGRAIAQALAEAGRPILVVDRDPAVREVAAQLGADAVVCDLGDRAAVRQLAGTIASRADGCAVLVNNAAVNPDRPDGTPIGLEDLTDDDWDWTLQVNLWAPMALTRAVLPGMRSAGWGRIVNIASRAASTYVAASNAAYTASKAGLGGMTRLVAGEVAGAGITVNAVAPGRVETPMAARQPPEVIAAAVRASPVGRVGRPEEIAAAVRYLVSEAAGFVTGHTVDVNGGAYMR